MADSAKQMEIEDGETDEMVVGNLSLYLFLTIRTAQLQHGLRHGDYERYRKYCSARLKRLRQKLGIASKKSHRGGKQNPKTTELSSIADPRILRVPLMICERGWAHGMQKKGELAALGHYPKRRATMLRKFRQAMRGANQLVMLCAKKCDQRTCIEVEGYSEMIKGVFYMESETKYLEALTHFTKAKKIVEGLAKASEVEAQSVFIQVAEELEPNIRFCQYQLQKTEEPPPLPSFDELQERLSQIELEAKPKSEATSNSLVIIWRNSQFPISNEKLSENLAVAQKLEQQVLTHTQGDHSTLLALYEKIIPAYGDMETNIKKALAAGGGVSIFAGEDLERLQTPVVGKLLQHSIKRTEIQIKRNTELFHDALVKSLSSKKQQELKTRSDTLLRLHDTIIGLILEESDLGSKLGGAEGESLIEECSALAAFYQAYRCYYLAHGYSSGGSSAESYALFDRCMSRSEDAVSQLSDLMNYPASDLIEDLNMLSKKARALKFASQSEISASDLLRIQESQKQFDDLDLEEKRGKKAKKTKDTTTYKYMANNLESWESFAGYDGKNIKLFKIPPPLYPIPVRPIVLDSALNHIQRPDLKDRIPQQEAGSTISRLLGFSGWRKS